MCCGERRKDSEKALDLTVNKHSRTSNQGACIHVLLPVGLYQMSGKNSKRTNSFRQKPWSWQPAPLMRLVTLAYISCIHLRANV